MSTIKDIEKINGGFGFGQSSQDPHDYWSGRNDGAIYTSMLPDDHIHAIIKTDNYWLYVYDAAGKFALKIADHDKSVLPVNIINVAKTFDNTISPEALVKAADEELKVFEFKRFNKYDSSLALYRHAYGLSLDGLAELSGVNRIVIHRYESKERSIKQARYDTLCKLARALQRTVEEITEF